MSHKRKSNKRKKRSVKKRLLILCEGETERNYFRAMREDVDFKQKMAATNIRLVTLLKNILLKISFSGSFLIKISPELGYALIFLRKLPKKSKFHKNIF